jgi:hypothetical protein
MIVAAPVMTVATPVMTAKGKVNANLAAAIPAAGSR